MLALLAPINVLEVGVMDLQSGNLANALASVVVILAFPRLGLARVEDSARRGLSYPMSWHAIIAYCAWHMAFVYGYGSGHGHAGDYLVINAAVLAVPVVAAWRYGTRLWLHARAYTLAMWLLMVEMTVMDHPAFWPLTHGALYHPVAHRLVGAASLLIAVGSLAHLYLRRRSAFDDTILAQLLGALFRPAARVPAMSAARRVTR